MKKVALAYGSLLVACATPVIPYVETSTGVPHETPRKDPECPALALPFPGGSKWLAKREVRDHVHAVAFASLESECRTQEEQVVLAPASGTVVVEDPHQMFTSLTIQTENHQIAVKNVRNLSVPFSQGEHVYRGQPLGWFGALDTHGRCMNIKVQVSDRAGNPLRCDFKEVSAGDEYREVISKNFGALWHPDGSVIKVYDTGKSYFIKERMLHPLPREHRYNAILVSEDEIACYALGEAQETLEERVAGTVFREAGQSNFFVTLDDVGSVRPIPKELVYAMNYREELIASVPSTLLGHMVRARQSPVTIDEVFTCAPLEQSRICNEPNLIKNGSFEEGLTHWLLEPYPDHLMNVIRDCEDRADGTCSIKLLPGEVGPWYVHQWKQVEVPLVAGDRYELFLWARTDTKRSFVVQVLQEGAPWINGGVWQNFEATREWKLFAVPFTALAIDGAYRFAIHVSESIAPLWIDNIVLRRSCS